MTTFAEVVMNLERLMPDLFAAARLGRAPCVAALCPNRHPLGFHLQLDASRGVRLELVDKYGSPLDEGGIASVFSADTGNRVCSEPGCPQPWPCTDHPPEQAHAQGPAGLSSRSQVRCPQARCTYDGRLTNVQLLEAYTRAVATGAGVVRLTA